MKLPSAVNRANPPRSRCVSNTDPVHITSRASPEYMVSDASPSIFWVGSKTSNDVPSVVSFTRITHQPFPSVAAAVNVWVNPAVAWMTLLLSPAARMVSLDRAS